MGRPKPKNIVRVTITFTEWLPDFITPEGNEGFWESDIDTLATEKEYDLTNIVVTCETEA